MSDEPAVVRERRGAVLVLRINRPEARNALNPAVMGGVGAGLAEAENDPDIRAVVLTGTGDRSFCAGMDLAAFAGGGMAPSPEEQEGMKTFGSAPSTMTTSCWLMPTRVSARFRTSWIFVVS